MAGVEKIYGSIAQWDELYEWLVRNNFNLVKELRERPAADNTTIAHFSHESDIWLWNNCTIKWVIDAIWDQYDGPPSCHE